MQVRFYYANALMHFAVSILYCTVITRVKITRRYIFIIIIIILFQVCKRGIYQYHFEYAQKYIERYGGQPCTQYCYGSITVRIF